LEVTVGARRKNAVKEQVNQDGMTFQELLQFSSEFKTSEIQSRKYQRLHVVFHQRIFTIKVQFKIPPDKLQMIWASL
jgi:hypothetical protein